MYASTSSKTMNGTVDKLDVEELRQIGTRCRELRKEKDMLQESQAQNFELIRKLEAHAKSLSEAHAEDKVYIQKLERELMNCNQEIDYLQDQINSRNTEVHRLEKHVQILELKLLDMENLQTKVMMLSEDLERSDSERQFLIEHLERKELELRMSSLSIEKLEGSVSSVALESQCEIESMRLDLMAVEQNYFEAKKLQEKGAQENARLNSLIEKLELQLEESRGIIDYLEKDNKELTGKVNLSSTSTREFFEKFAVHVEEILSNERTSKVDPQILLTKVGSRLAIPKEMREILDPLLSILATIHAPHTSVTKKMEKMSLQIQEYELIVKQLKEELREQKLKAKDEAEDLAQEMAELRYQMTCLLEEECKRRASIEQASLQRITELEAQVIRLEKNRRKHSLLLNI